MKFKRNLKLKTSILDLVPIVDIFFIVIVFVVLSMKNIGVGGIVVDLPKIKNYTVFEERLTIVTIAKEGFYINQKKVVKDDMLQALKENMLDNTESVLIVKADKSTRYSNMLDVVSMAKTAGYKKIAIASEG